MRHDLKIWPEYYAAVTNGTKTFEARTNDRDYQQGDYVILREWNPEPETYPEPKPIGHTGKWLEFKIGYVLTIDAERVVFSLLAIK